MTSSPAQFENLTPEQKRALLGELLKEKARQKAVTCPASDGQRAMWYIHQTAPSSPAYNVAFSARIRSTVQVDQLQKAIQAVVNRHATLRTRYLLRDGELLQEIRDYEDAAFEQVDASGWDEDALYQAVNAAARQPFALDSGPVARWGLFTRSASDHVLLLAVHHIAIDAASLWIVLNDLRQALDALAAGRPIQLAPPPRPYADWPAVQQELVNSQAGLASQAFWQQQLGGELPVLNLPLDFPRPALLTYNGRSLPFAISAEQTRRIKALAQAEGVTLYMLLLAVYQVMLHRFTGQDEILVGTPTAGRSHPDFLQTVGYFINPVTLRSDLSGGPDFRTFLSRVRETVRNALAHQEIPFIRVVEGLHPRQDPGRSAVFQCLFNLHSIQHVSEIADLLTQAGPAARVSFGGLLLEPYYFPQEEGQFELALEMVDTGETLQGSLRYNSDLFREETVERFGAAIHLLLDAVTDHPDRSIASLPVVRDSDRRWLLEDLNQTQADFPAHLTAVRLFEDQVERTPGAPALIYEDQRLTYHQLNQRANQLAHLLRSRGIGLEDMVGIYLERSPEMIIALLGVLKAGAAYVPMDPVYPPDRIGYMIEDSQMRLIITQEELSESLPGGDVDLLLVDRDQHAIGSQPDGNLTAAAGPDNLAYVIFTSGSTGRPKGVQVPHSALANLLAGLRSLEILPPGAVMGFITTISFDIAAMEIYLPLVSGAQVVILRPEVYTDGYALAQALEDDQITALQGTPATWRLLLETGWAGKPDLTQYIGGEGFSLSLAKELLGKGASLWNLYGPTEATVWCTGAQISAQDELVSIGRPLPNTQAYILDKNLQPVPPGVTGTLYVGGACLARGYLNRPDLTAEKFIPHPFQEGSRLYNTGDLARFLPDGRIECLGRDDSQVKLRGFRIELGEIEEVLRQHPAVQHAVVLLREDTPGSKKLAAYYTADGEPSPRELSRFLKAKLPAYMLPAAYVRLDEFPLTPNGKVNRRALPVPGQMTGEAPAEASPPSSLNEVFVAGVWKELLQVERVGVSDNFFDLGGHSLLAVQACARIREQTGFRLEPNYLRLESVGQIASRLDQHQSRQAGQA